MGYFYFSWRAIVSTYAQGFPPRLFGPPCSPSRGFGTFSLIFFSPYMLDQR